MAPAWISRGQALRRAGALRALPEFRNVTAAIRSIKNVFTVRRPDQVVIYSFSTGAYVTANRITRQQNRGIIGWIYANYAAGSLRASLPAPHVPQSIIRPGK